jgi:exodeoxyribonuclease V beta subunit
MRARQDIGDAHAWTLSTNWRSTPEMVSAVNRVFQRDEAFVYTDIPFLEARAAEREHAYLAHEGHRLPAMTLWQLPEQSSGNSHNLDDTRGMTHDAVAGKIRWLLDEGAAGRLRIDHRAVVAGDIAVLVRTSFEAEGLQRALKRAGVQSVANNRDNIWHTGEATALLLLLEAVVDHRNRRLARQALSCEFLDYTAQEIQQLIEDDGKWSAWIELLQHGNELWQRQGFMPAYQYLLRQLDLDQRLSRCELPERRLTNLLHLGELLQEAARAHSGQDALLAWFREQKEIAERDSSELRLENDEQLVQIVTIHRSKGLEYPIVFVPYLFGCRTADKNSLIQWHDAGVHRVALDWTDNDAEFLHAERERLAEDVRLAYVALTRAGSALWLIWGGAGQQAGQSALGWLLQPRQTAEDLFTQRPQAFAKNKSPDFNVLQERLAGDASSIVIEPLPVPADIDPAAGETAVQPQLQAALFDGMIADDWRISSFTSLTRDLHQAFTPAPEPQPDPSFALQYRAGANVGSFMHLLLEKLQLDSAQFSSEATRLAPQLAPRFGLDCDSDTANQLAAWLQDVVASPLAEDGPRLMDLADEQIVKEMNFDFATGSVDIKRLNELLQQAAGSRPLHAVTTPQFRGMVNGIIDLVFEYRGRYYLADYKSNLLGRRYDDYSADKLVDAVYGRRYDLQYLLYTLALHRHLSQCLPGYDYARHFGGVYYLFLRAMQPGKPPGQGVYHACPEADLIGQLDHLVFPWESVA